MLWLLRWYMSNEELLEKFKKDIPVKKDDKHFKWWYLIIIILIGVLIGVLLISLIDYFIKKWYIFIVENGCK